MDIILFLCIMGFGVWYLGWRGTKGAEELVGLGILALLAYIAFDIIRRALKS